MGPVSGGGLRYLGPCNEIAEGPSSPSAGVCFALVPTCLIAALWRLKAPLRAPWLLSSSDYGPLRTCHLQDCQVTWAELKGFGALIPYQRQQGQGLGWAGRLLGGAHKPPWHGAGHTAGCRTPWQGAWHTVGCKFPRQGAWHTVSASLLRQRGAHRQAAEPKPAELG